jgi:type IV secretory pathway VirB9-like protein
MERYAFLIALLLMTASPLAMAQTQERPPFGDASSGDDFNPPDAVAPLPGAGGAPAAAMPNFMEQTSSELQAQASGQFPAMQRSGSMPIGAIQRRWSNPRAATGQAAPGIMRFTWRPDFVMPIRTREFMSTTIELPNWENIEKIILGDTMVFEATKIKTHVLVVRPTNAGADTNMTVLGASGNIYNFYLRSEGWNTKDITDLTVYIAATAAGTNIAPSPMSAAGATPPPPPAMQGSVPAPMYNNENFSVGGNQALQQQRQDKLNTLPDYVRSIVIRPENLRFDLRIFAPTPADVEIAPLRAFTDGTWTYFDFGDKADTVRRPVVARVIDGVDTMINTRTAGPTGNILIAEAIGNFTLRNGDRVICVYQSPATAASQYQHPGMQSVTGYGGTQPQMFGDPNNRAMGQVAPGVPPQLRAGFPPPPVMPTYTAPAFQQQGAVSTTIPANRADRWFNN